MDRVVSSDEKITINAPKDPNAEKISVTFVDALDPAKNKTVELTKTPDGKYRYGTTEYEVDQDGKIKVDVPEDVTLTDISIIETKATDELGNESEVSSRKVIHVTDGGTQTEDPIPIENLPENPSVDNIPPRDGYVVVEFTINPEEGVLSGTRFYYVKIGTEIGWNNAPRIIPNPSYRVKYEMPWDKTLPYRVMENTVIRALLDRFTDIGVDPMPEPQPPYVPSEPAPHIMIMTVPKEVIVYKDEEVGVHKSYVNGYPDGTFRPERGITRGEVAAIFTRILTNKNAMRKSETAFSDVTKEMWFSGSVKYLTDGKVLTGYPDGTFRPNAPITRAEFATIVARLKALNGGGEDKFYDLGGHWAKARINAVASEGIVNGYPDGTFKPNKDITRAEAVKITNKLLNRDGDHDYLVTHDDYERYSDVSESHWAFDDIYEASFTHMFKRNENGTETWKDLAEIDTNGNFKGLVN